MGASNSETTYRIHHWRMQGFGGDLWSLIAPADPEVILWSLIAGEGKLIAIISAFAAECDPAVRKKNIRKFTFTTFFFQSEKTRQKHCFSMSLSMLAVLQMESESFPLRTSSPQQNQPPELVSSLARWACTCSWSPDQPLRGEGIGGINRRLRNPTRD